MRRFGLTAAVLAASALLCASIASANTITINGGESPTFPPTFTTLASSSSPVTLPATMCCGATDSFMVSATATGTPPLTSGQFDSNTIDINMGAAGTLILWFTETGLTSPIGTVNVTSGLTSNLVSGAITSVTLSTFLSTSNAVSPPNGTPLDTATFTSIGTQTATTSVAAGAGPYSLQEVYTIIATGAGNVDLTIDMTASATPEPTSFALFAIALSGLGCLRWRRRISQRKH